MRGRSLLAGALVGSAALILPASSMGAVDFGSNLLSTPDYEACAQSCTLWNTTLHPANTQGSITAPMSGVVVSFTIKKDVPTSGPWVPLHLRIVQPFVTPADPFWRGLGASSPNVTPAGVAGLQAFGVRLPIKQGDYLAMELAAAGAYYNRGNSVFGANRRVAAPALPVDGTEQGTNSYNAEILLQGRIEPDADGDGFGDETQDACPASAATQAACAQAKKKKCKRERKAKGDMARSASKRKCKRRKKR